MLKGLTEVRESHAVECNEVKLLITFPQAFQITVSSNQGTLLYIICARPKLQRIHFVFRSELYKCSHKDPKRMRETNISTYIKILHL